MYKNKERCQKCGNSIHIEVFQCPAKKFQCKSSHKYGQFTSLCYQKKQALFKPRKPKTYMLQAWVVYVCDMSICSHSENCSSSNEPFCLQVKIQHTHAECKKIPTPSHLITNLTYKLKPHQTRNQYLRTRLDTCTDVYIMPAHVYFIWCTQTVRRYNKWLFCSKNDGSVLHYNTCAWTDTTLHKIELFATQS